MEINKIQNSPNFKARIVIQKTGFQNLGADLVDSFKLGSKTTQTGTSVVTETTILPSDATNEFSFAKKTVQFVKDEFGKIFDRIFHRNIKTSEIEGIDMKEAASNSAVTASGASSISAGIGSYDVALGSAVDQSANRYATTIYDASIPEMLKNNLPASAWEHIDNMERLAYRNLYNERGFGNETASSASTTASGIGSSFQGFGYELLTKGKKAFNKAEEAQRSLPS